MDLFGREYNFQEEPSKLSKSFQIREIHDPVLVFYNTPVFSSGPITAVVVVDNVRNADGILGFGKTDTAGQENRSRSVSFAINLNQM